MTNQEHAIAIAKKLMTNSEGEVADRMAMQRKMNVGFGFDREHDLGGRNATSMENTILNYLNENFPETIPSPAVRCPVKFTNELTGGIVQCVNATGHKDDCMYNRVLEKQLWERK